MSISNEGNAYLQVSSLKLKSYILLIVQSIFNYCLFIKFFNIQESQFWKLYKQDRASCSLVVRTSVGLVYLLSCLLEPFMPSFSIKVRFTSCTQYIVSLRVRGIFQMVVNHWPILHFPTLKVLKQLNLPPEKISLCDETGDLERAKKPWESLPAGHKIGTPEPLFKELVHVLFFYSHLQ